MIWLLPLLLIGFNLTLWTAVGGVRFVSEKVGRRPSAPPSDANLSPEDVAVIVPAHDEQLVIASTLKSVLRVTVPSNVHVIADGCTDDTEKIARSFGVNVLELEPARGKAGGIEAAIERFQLPERFEAVLIVDADTELDEHYLERALPMLTRPEVVAIAGYARTSWRPSELRLIGRILVSYRTRLYAVMQWMKYGQTWWWTNVTAVVPGFASMYRANVLRKLDVNPPGLIIEDFNMTFEIHHKRLGKIGFRRNVKALTQDPDNARDYCRQVMRWQLGFWQTIRRHGFWLSGFSAALAFFLLEVLLASLLLIAVATASAVLVVSGVLGDIAGHPHWLGAPDRVLGDYLTLTNVLLFLALPDYLLTCLVAILARRPSLLLYGISFLPLRLVDSVITLRTLPLAWRETSTGQWTSPARRLVGVPAATHSGARSPTAALAGTVRALGQVALRAATTPAVRLLEPLDVSSVRTGSLAPGHPGDRRASTVRPRRPLAIPVVLAACWAGRAMFPLHSAEMLITGAVACLAAAYSLLFTNPRRRPWLAVVLSEAALLGIGLGLATTVVTR